MKTIKHVIIPAAGYGTRLLPASKAIPKEMFPLVDSPAIGYIVQEASDCKINNIVLITSKNKDSIVDHFDNNYELESILASKKKYDLLEKIRKHNNLNFINIRQREALGLGHAVLTGKEVVDNGSAFVVILPDMFINNASVFLQKMIDIYNETGKGVIALMEVPKNKVNSYGIVSGDYDEKTDIINIKDLIEKPTVEEAPSNFAILGRYILPFETMNYLEEETPDKTGEIQLTNALKKVATNHGLIGLVIRSDIYDIGNPLGFLKANISFGLRNPEYSEELRKFIKEIM